MMLRVAKRYWVSDFRAIAILPFAAFAGPGNDSELEAIGRLGSVADFGTLIAFYSW
jgi:hypothetical protein